MTISSEKEESGELKKIRRFSSLVEKKLSTFTDKDKSRIQDLSFEELQDLQLVLRLVDFVYFKYERKKEMRTLLRYFVDMLSESTNSVDAIDEEINELVMSAETALGQIKNLQSNVTENFAFGRPETKSCDKQSQEEPKIVQKI